MDLNLENSFFLQVFPVSIKRYFVILFISDLFLFQIKTKKNLPPDS